MTRAKVCGLTSARERDAAIEAGADALGFLVDVPVETERELTAEAAADLVAGVPPFVTSVLVTMPSAADRALELIDGIDPDAIQLHNDLPVGAVGRVERSSAAKVIKAIDADRGAAERYAPVADALLVDARTASGAGGTGRRSDWDRASAVRAAVECPVILAGGLDPENVAAAIATVEPYAVDVSSGVERVEGRKDPEAIRDFLEAVHRRPAHP